MKTSIKVLAWILLLSFLTPGKIHACAVPVFRYALERWQPSSYDGYLFHEGPLAKEDSELLKLLKGSSKYANLKLVTVDLNEEVPELAKMIWSRNKSKASLPWLIIQFPQEDHTFSPAWQGSLQKAGDLRLLDSPKRRQLAKHLIAGESAVWILLTSGYVEEDKKAEQLLTRELARLQKEIKLPIQKEEDGPPLTALPLVLSFKILKVDRKDPKEAGLVHLLLNSDPDLVEAKGPIVFPTFGRGRVLTGLTGDELSSAKIERWASFLAGPCSCQVKELNPGVDLLMAIDWKTELNISSAPEPEISELKTPIIPEGESSSKESDDSVTTNRQPSGQTFVWFGLGVAMLAMLLAGVWAFQTGKSTEH